MFYFFVSPQQLFVVVAAFSAPQDFFDAAQLFFCASVHPVAFALSVVFSALAAFPLQHAFVSVFFFLSFSSSIVEEKSSLSATTVTLDFSTETTFTDALEIETQ